MKKLGLIFILLIVASFDLTSGDYFKKQTLLQKEVYRDLTSFKGKKVCELLDLIGYDIHYYSFNIGPNIKPGISLIYQYNDDFNVHVIIKIKDIDNFTPNFFDINLIKDEVTLEVLYFLERKKVNEYEILKEVNDRKRQMMESKFYPLENGFKPELNFNRKIRAVKKYEARYISLLKAFEGLQMNEILDKIGNDYYGYFLSRYDEFEDDSAGYYNEIDLRYPYKDSLEISVVLFLENSFIFHDIKDLENAKNIKVFEIRNYLLPVNQRKDFIRIGNYKE